MARLLSFFILLHAQGVQHRVDGQPGECSPKANQPTIFPRSLKNRVETMSGGGVVDPGNVLWRLFTLRRHSGSADAPPRCLWSAVERSQSTASCYLNLDELGALCWRYAESVTGLCAPSPRSHRDRAGTASTSTGVTGCLPLTWPGQVSPASLNVSFDICRNPKLQALLKRALPEKISETHNSGCGRQTVLDCHGYANNRSSCCETTLQW